MRLEFFGYIWFIFEKNTIFLPFVFGINESAKYFAHFYDSRFR